MGDNGRDHEIPNCFFKNYWKSKLKILEVGQEVERKLNEKLKTKFYVSRILKNELKLNFFSSDRKSQIPY